MAKATVNLYFDTRKCEEGTCIVKWSIICERKPRLFTTGRKITLTERSFLQDYKHRKLDNRIKDSEKIRLWQEMYGDTFQDHLSGREQVGYLKRAQIVVAQLGDNFTFEAFADLIGNFGKEPIKPINQSNLIAALFSKAQSMSAAGRIGNATNYEVAAKSLQRFIDSFTDEERKEFLNIPIPRKSNSSRPEAVLMFEHLTPDFLHTYEQWMGVQGKAPKTSKKAPTGASSTTIGIYLRHVRSVVNDAIRSGNMSREAYPFGPSKFVIPAGANIKKALPKSDIEKIKAFRPEADTFEQRSHDLWLFSYFCNGANMTDICRLTWGQIDLKEGKATFIRKKTSRSKKQNQSTIVTRLRPETIAVIERWGTENRHPTNYVFPFLTLEMTEQQRVQAIHQIIKVTNKWMRKIADQLGIEADVNTYSARHSFATILLKSKAPLAFISKSLGHTNISTTENYLGSFDDDEAREILEAL